MSDITKAGWLMRQTTALKRWKKQWFSLTRDGYFRYFENCNDNIALDTIHMPTEAFKVFVGQDVMAEAPSGFKTDSLIMIQASCGEWILCANDVDDMLAWQMALEQARVMNVHGPQVSYQAIPGHLKEILKYSQNRYPLYYKGKYQGTFPSREFETPKGPITVVYLNEPYRYAYDSDESILAGAALASCLFLPFWFPFFWFGC